MKDKITTNPIDSLVEQDVIEPIDETQGIIDDIVQFRAAVGQAQLAGVKELTVSKRIMKHIVGSEVDAITYGNPAVLISLPKEPKE